MCEFHDSKFLTATVSEIFGGQTNSSKINLIDDSALLQ